MVHRFGVMAQQAKRARCDDLSRDRLDSAVVTFGKRTLDLGKSKWYYVLLIVSMANSSSNQTFPNLRDQRLHHPIHPVSASLGLLDWPAECP
jgi:hypothetical protein